MTAPTTEVGVSSAASSVARRAAAAIGVEHLQVVRGTRTVLDDISLVVPPGSITGPLGPSAAARPRCSGRSSES